VAAVLEEMQVAALAAPVAAETVVMPMELLVVLVPLIPVAAAVVVAVRLEVVLAHLVALAVPVLLSSKYPILILLSSLVALLLL
jgi:hypothetical protein